MMSCSIQIRADCVSFSVWEIEEIFCKISALSQKRRTHFKGAWLPNKANQKLFEKSKQQQLNNEVSVTFHDERA